MERRSRALLVVVDTDGRLVLSEGDAVRILINELQFDREGRPKLKSELLAQVRERLASLAETGEAAPLWIGHLLVRVIPVAGIMGEFTVISVEALRRREDLVAQRTRYGLTARELDVLRLILQGLTASEVAQILCITKHTVTDYFKSLLRKTGSRNRSEMLAKMLGWEKTA